MNLFEKFSVDYDKMINWSNRLPREGKFIKECFDQNGVQRVLDLGCGTGQHAIMLAKWGLKVTAIDPSAAMIAAAQENASQAEVELELHTAGFQDFRALLTDKFDAVLILGNSLPHLLSDQELAQCLGDIASVLKAGGILLIQNRNYDKVLIEKDRFMPLNSWEEQGQENLFLRFNDFLEDRIDFNIINISKQEGKWTYQVFTNPLRPLLAAEMTKLLSTAGFHHQYYGDYQGNPYQEMVSADLIVFARKIRQTT